jgi:Mn-dependent DtxR family transcriptional regulator
MSEKNALTPSLEDYLKTIYRLHRMNRAVRLVDIADKMSVSKPSVNAAVAKLTEKGLVAHEKGGPIGLTDKGSAAAKKLCDKFDTIKRFLMRTLSLSEPAAEDEAHALEHTIRDETLTKMED